MPTNEQKGLFIPRVVLYDTQLSPALKMVYAAMIEATDDDGICCLSAKTLGERLTMGEAAVNRNRLELCRIGYIQHVPGTNRNYKLLKIKKKKERTHENT